MLKSFLCRLVKGRHTFLDPRRYVFPTKEPTASAEALKIARAIRGAFPPAILIHGVMPRSGTVFASELLGLHPDLCNYPREIYEFPFLRTSGDVFTLHEKFIAGYELNREKISGHDFLTLFGASILAYLYSAVPKDQRMLLKVPRVEYLFYFYAAFPSENLLVLMRDGRDVVSSAMKTWPKLSFVDVCRWWNYSARLILQCNQRFSGQPNYYYARYEDAVNDPTGFVRGVCRQFGVDENRYPFDQIHNLPLFGSSTVRNGKKVIWKPLEKPKDFNPIGRWVSWSEGRKRTFKKIAGQTLIDLGYCVD